MTVKDSKIPDCTGNPKDRRPCWVRVPTRYILTFFLAIGNCIIVSLRVNMNIAIVAMVRHSNLSSVSLDNETLGPSESVCPQKEDMYTQIPDGTRTGSFDWSPSIQGVILGGFYYGYICTQVFGGRMAERFGARLIYSGGTLLSSGLTLLVPVAADFSFTLLVVVRILIGATQGVVISSMYHLVSNWFPTSERGLHLALVMTGTLIGNVVTMPLVGYLCQYGFSGGWPSAFYVFGAVGCVFSFFFILLTSSKPEDHPRITEKELLYIQQGIGKQQKNAPIPWSRVLSSVPVWALAIQRMTSAFAYHIILSKVPAYLDAVLRYPIEENGLINAALYVSKMVTGIIAGQTSDVLIRRRTLSINTTRKLFQGIASVGAGVCLLAVPLMRCNSLAVVALLTTCLGIHGLQNGGEMPVVADMAPVGFSGTLFGLTNSFASITGFLAPSVAGLFLDGNDASLIRWSYVFYLSAGICVFGCIVFIILGSANRLNWDQMEFEPETNTITTLEFDQGSTEVFDKEEKQRY